MLGRAEGVSEDELRRSPSGRRCVSALGRVAAVDGVTFVSLNAALIFPVVILIFLHRLLLPQLLPH